MTICRAQTVKASPMRRNPSPGSTHAGRTKTPQIDALKTFPYKSTIMNIKRLFGANRGHTQGIIFLLPFLLPVFAYSVAPKRKVKNVSCIGNLHML